MWTNIYIYININIIQNTSMRSMRTWNRDILTTWSDQRKKSYLMYCLEGPKLNCLIKSQLFIDCSKIIILRIKLTPDNSQNYKWVFCSTQNPCMICYVLNCHTLLLENRSSSPCSFVHEITCPPYKRIYIIKKKTYHLWSHQYWINKQAT